MDQFLPMRDGVQLFTQLHLRSPELPWLVLTHGIGENLKRHQYIVELFGHSWNLCRYDLRGHGRSQGRRSYIESFAQFNSDLEDLLTTLNQRFTPCRFALMGHSMGALITCSFLHNYPGQLPPPLKVVLSAPPVRVPGALGHFLHSRPNFTTRLAAIPMSLPIPGLIRAPQLSHDPQVARDYCQDPLNHRLFGSRLLLNLVQTAQQIFAEDLPISKYPLACFVGTEDSVIDLAAVVAYFQGVAQRNPLVQFQQIPQGRHELHLEIPTIRTLYVEKLVHFLTHEN